MTRLRKMMLDEIERRNYSQNRPAWDRSHQLCGCFRMIPQRYQILAQRRQLLLLLKKRILRTVLTEIIIDNESDPATH